MTIEEAINSSVTMAQAAQKLNMPFSSFVRKAKELNVYRPNQGAKGTSKPFTRNAHGYRRNLNDIVDGKHPEYPTTKLKDRLISEGYLPNECAWCGLHDIWNDKPIVLQLDHVNGVNNDHRLSNLRLLCPNCHSQTDTWCGRNKVDVAE